MPPLTNRDYSSASHAQSVVPPPRTCWQPIIDIDEAPRQQSMAPISRMTWHSLLRHRDAEALDFTPPTADERESPAKTDEKDKEKEKEKENWDPPLEWTLP